MNKINFMLTLDPERGETQKQRLNALATAVGLRGYSTVAQKTADAFNVSPEMVTAVFRLLSILAQSGEIKEEELRAIEQDFVDAVRDAYARLVAHGVLPKEF